MEEELEKMALEKEEAAKEAISMLAGLESAQKECLALIKQLEEDKQTYDIEMEAIRLKISAKETMEAELRTEQEKFDSSIATLSKEGDELSIQLDESKQKLDSFIATLAKEWEELFVQLDESKRKGDVMSVRIASLEAGLLESKQDTAVKATEEIRTFGSSSRSVYFL